jgi:oxygen-independent coproporphyrinogen-3 oxidase
LIKEISQYKISSNSLDSIYIGGGTPSSLTISEIEPLLEHIQKMIKSNGEYTIECNVTSLDEDKIKLYERYGVNRFSLGVESTDRRILSKMERDHDFDDVKRVVEMIKNNGIDNINVDLIYAVPGESKAMLEKDLDNLLSLDVPHISTYSLILEEGTKFYRDGEKELDQDLVREQYDIILNRLRTSSYRRYEVSNFAREGKESRHNLTYWHNLQYYGVGLGASGYLGNVRYTNTRNINKYIDRRYISETEVLTKADLEEYYLMLALRLDDGFSKTDFKKIFGYDFVDRYSSQLKKMKDECLLRESNDRIMATDEGIMLLDRIMMEFIANGNSTI